MRLNLKVFRVSKNMTQGEFADRVGVDRATYSNIELGKRSGKTEFWNNLQKEFDVPDSEMYGLMKIDKGE